MTTCQDCYTFQYPVVFGGYQGDTRYLAIDMDSSGNVALGGVSTDPNVIHKNYGVDYEVPITLVMDDAQYYRWGTGFQKLENQRISDVKFNPAGTLVISLFDTENRGILALAAQDASDGSLETIRYESGANLGSNSVHENFYKMLLMDSLDTIYFTTSARAQGQAEIMKLPWKYFNSVFTVTYTNSANPLQTLTFGATESEIYYAGYIYDTVVNTYYYIHAKIDSSGNFIWHSAEDQGSSAGFPVPVILVYTTGYLLDCTQFDGTNKIKVGAYTLADPALPSFDYYELQDGDYTLSECVQMSAKSTDLAQLLIRQTGVTSVDYFYIELNYNTGTTLVMNRLDSYQDQEIYDYYQFGSILYLVGAAVTIQDGFGIYPTWYTTKTRAFLMRFNPSDPNEQSCLDITSMITPKAISFTASGTGTLPSIGASPSYTSTARSFSYQSGLAFHTIVLFHNLDNTWCSPTPLSIESYPIPDVVYYVGQPTQLIDYDVPVVTGTCDDPTPFFFYTRKEFHWGWPDAYITRWDYTTGDFDVYNNDCSYIPPWVDKLYLYGTIFTGQSFREPFTLTILYDCPIATITTSGDIEHIYKLSDPSESLPMSMAILDDYCDNCDIVLTCLYANGNSLDTAVFTQGGDVTNPYIDIYTTDISKHGLHQLQCTGQINGLYSTSVINVDVMIELCESSTLTTVIPTDQTYYIYQDSTPYAFTEWYTDLPDCNLLFDYTFQHVLPPPLPFLSLDSDNREFTTYSTDLTDIGTYTVELTGTYGTLSASETFTYSVLDPCLLATLTFTQIPNQEYSIYNELNFDVTFTSAFVAPITAPISTSICGTITYTLAACSGHVSDFSNFVTLDQVSKQLTVDSDNLEDEGSFCVCVNGEHSGYATSLAQNCFDLEVTGPCSNPTVPSDFSGTYLLGSDPETFSVPAFIPQLPECVFKYKVFFLNGDELDSDLISFDEVNMLLTVESFDPEDVGLHYFEVRVLIGDFLLNVDPVIFTLTVTPNECLDVAIESPPIIENQEYIVNEQPRTVVIELFQQDPSFCGFLFTYQAMLSNGMELPEFIEFIRTPSQLLFEIYSESSFDANQYLIEVRADLNDSLASPLSITWVLDVFAHPYLQYDLVDQHVEAGQSLTYPFIPMDPQGAYPFTYFVDLDGAEDFIFLDLDTPAFIISPEIGQISSQRDIELSFTNQIGLESEKYKFSVYITEVVIESQTVVNTTIGTTIGAQISSNSDESVDFEVMVAQNGVLVVTFDEPVNIPDGWEQMDDKNLTIKISPVDDIEEAFYNFTWAVQNFTRQYMTIQLHFENPEDISSTTTESDIVQLEFQEGTIIQANITGLTIPTTAPKNTTLPKQAAPEKIKAIQSLNFPMNSILYAVFFSSLAVSTAVQLPITLMGMAQPSQPLWGMVNSLQMIVYPQLFALQFPVLTRMVFQMLMDFVSLNFADIKKVLSFLSFSETEPFNDYFFEAGLEDKNAIHNMGLMFLAFLGALIACPVFVIFGMWSALIRVCTQEYLRVGLSGLVHAQEFHKNTSGDYFVSIMVVLSIGSVVTIPLIMAMYLVNGHQKILKIERPKTRFEESQVIPKSSLKYTLIFLLRCLLLIILAMTLDDSPGQQVQIMMVAGLIQLSALLYLKPFEDSLMMGQAVFNEATVIVVHYQFLAFTDFESGPLYRERMGYSIIAVIVFNLLVNIIFILYYMWLQCKWLARVGWKQLKALWTPNAVHQQRFTSLAQFQSSLDFSKKNSEDKFEVANVNAIDLTLKNDFYQKGQANDYYSIWNQDMNNALHENNGSDLASSQTMMNKAQNIKPVPKKASNKKVDIQIPGFVQNQSSDKYEMNTNSPIGSSQQTATNKQHQDKQIGFMNIWNQWKPSADNDKFTAKGLGQAGRQKAKY